MTDQRPARRLVAGRLSLRRPATASRDHVRLTSVADRREHRVHATAYACAITASTGQAEAVCGHLVVMAALATPPGTVCPACAAAVPDVRTW